MTQEKKERIPIWMNPSMIRDVDRLFPDNGYKSRSEFVSSAVEMYVGYISTQSAENYISQSLLSQMNNRLEKAEARLCSTIFKLAVELSITMCITASICEVDDDTLVKLRKRCIREVKRSLGTVRFDNLYDYQKGRTTEISCDSGDGVTLENMVGV